MLDVIITNKILIANALMTVYMVCGFFAETIINRRKYTKVWMFLRLFGAIPFFLLGAKQGVFCSLWASMKFFLILYVLHPKEEKYIQKPLETFVLGIPYLVFAILDYKEGIFAVLYGLSSFVNSCQFMAKTDVNKYRIGYCTNVFQAIYSISVMNFTDAISCFISISIYIINILRIKKNGEDSYYGDRKEVNKDERTLK